MKQFVFIRSFMRQIWPASALLLASVTHVLGSTLAVGDPKHPAELPKAIYQAHEAGARDITINSGIYQLPSIAHGETLFFDQWKDTFIHATGVTMVFLEMDKCPVLLHRCTNVMWDGGTLLFVRPAFTQGRVIAVGTSGNEEHCDWQVDMGYSNEQTGKGMNLDVIDHETRVLKLATGDCRTVHYEQIKPGLFRLYFALGTIQNFTVNDWLVTRAKAGTNLFHLDESGSCTIKNVTLENGGFGTLFETGGEGDNHYLGCKIQPGPRPPGATEDQLVGCGADGIHSAGTRIGPDIEDCIFSGVFLDDCIAIHGSFERVLKVENGVVTLSTRSSEARVSEPLRIVDTKGFITQETCTSVQRMSDQDVQVTLDGNAQIPVDHSEDTDKRKGTKINNPNFCGRHYKILRCRLGNTRSRGILVKADDGVISHCTVEGCGMSAISIGPEFWWNEAGYCWNVNVSDSIFRNCNKSCGDQATLWVHNDGAMGNRSLAIENNTFENCYGKYILRIDGAEGVKIINSKISLPPPAKKQTTESVIWMTQSKNVELFSNTVNAKEGFKGRLVGFGEMMNGSDVRNNSPEGIRIIAATAKSDYPR